MLHTLIKAKSGLHAGASWRFDQGRVTLGSSAKADVFLCDPDIPEALITLRRRGRRYRIESVHDEVRLNASDHRKIDDVIFPAQVVNLDFRHIQLEIEVLSTSYNIANSFGDRFSQLLHGFTQMLREVGAKAICTMLLIIGLILTTAILFFGTAGVVKSQASTVPKPTELPRAELRKPKPMDVTQHMMANAEQEVRDFAQRIGTQRISVERKAGELSIQAVLSRSQHAEFEKALVQLGRDYGDNIDIFAKVKLSDEQLAVDRLDIEQIVLGSKPVVVLRDGMRLYLGGNIDGLTVSAINAQRVLLKGESAEYEVYL